MNIYCRNCQAFVDGRELPSGPIKCTEGNVIYPGTRACEKYNRIKRRRNNAPAHRLSTKRVRRRYRE